MSLQNYGLQEREEKKSILLTKLLFGEVGGYLSLFFLGLSMKTAVVAVYF
jgi:hypothetical protein